MTIQVLGSGCSTCKNLHELTQKAMAELGLSDPVEYITGNEAIQKIIAFGAVSSPLLVINDQVVMTGFTPDITEIKNCIQKALQ